MVHRTLGLPLRNPDIPPVWYFRTSHTGDIVESIEAIYCFREEISRGTHIEVPPDCSTRELGILRVIAKRPDLKPCDKNTVLPYLSDIYQNVSQE
jgi:hypothetical protein